MAAQKIGPYTLQSDIAHTDLADTSLAWDEDRQAQVVVKRLLPACLNDPSVRGRYPLEMQLVASLEHPAILPVLAFGEEDGRPYIVTPYLPGGSLADRLAQGPLPFDEAVRIVQAIAPALDAVHAIGLAHGNLKPTNILFDAAGQPHVTDFGMIMFAQSAAAGHASPAWIIGPLAYLSPEVAQGNVDIERTAAQDVYLLGGLFYQMLTGQLPFTAETVLGYAVAKITLPLPEIGGLAAPTQKRVQAIVQHALAAAPAERFASAGAFAAALQQPEKFAAPRKSAHTLPPLPAQIRTEAITPHLVIEAQPDAGDMPTVQMGRMGGPGCLGRGLSCLGALLALLALAAAVLLWGLAFVRQGVATQSDLQAYLPPPVVAFAGTFMPTSPPGPSVTPGPTASPTPTSDFTATPAEVAAEATFTPAPAAATPASTDLPASPTAQALAQGGTPTQLAPATSHTIVRDDTIFSIAALFNVGLNDLISLNGWRCDSRPAAGVQIQIPAAFTYGPLTLPDTLLLANATQFALQHTFECMAGVRDVALSADGRLLAVAVENQVYLWQVGDWKPYATLNGHIGPVNRVQFSPDVTTLATASEDTSVRLWQVSDGAQIKALYQHKRPVTDLAFAPDGSQFVSVSQERVQVWTREGVAVDTITGPANMLSVAFDAPGSQVAIGGQAGVTVFTAATGQTLAIFPSADPVKRLAFSPDGTLLASSSDVWHVPEKRLIYHLQSAADGVLFALDGQVLLTGRRLWQVSNGLLLGELNADGFPARNAKNAEAVALAPDGKFILLGTPGSLTTWALPAAYQASIAHVPPTYTVQAGDTLYSVASSQGVKLPALRALNGFTCDSPIFPGQRIWIPDTAEDQLTLAEAALPRIAAANITQVAAQRTLEMDCNITGSDLIFSSDNQLLIGGSALWHLPTGAMLLQATTVPLDLAGKPDANLRAPLLELAPDNRLLAMRTDATITLWDVATGHATRAWEGHEGALTSLAFSPDGSLLASGSAVGDPAIRLWRVENAKLEWLIPNYSIFRLMFSLDGQSLIGVGEDTVRVWSALENAQRWALRGLDARMAFSADRTMLAYVGCLQKAGSTCTSEGINIFALNRGTTFPGVMVSGMAQRIQAIQFAPDGRQVAAATEHGITIWNVADNTVAHWLAVPDRKDFMQRLWYSPDGALLLAYDERANLYFWQTSDGTLLHTIPNLPLDRLTFSPDGTLMAILAQGEITLWGIQP